MVERLFHRDRLEAAMDHAVGAFFVVADAIGVPVGLLHQLLEARRIAFPKKITRPLPAEDRARWIAPRRALIGSIASEKVEEKLGLEETPGLAAFAPAQNLPEEGFDFFAIEEMLLVGRAFIGVRNKPVYIALGVQEDGTKDYLGPWDRKHRRRQILAADDERRQRGSTPQPAPARSCGLTL
jgi:hypothetical protein